MAATNVHRSRSRSANIAIPVPKSPRKMNVFQAPTSPSGPRNDQTNAVCSAALAARAAGVRSKP